MNQTVDPRFKFAYLLCLKKVETTILLSVAALCLGVGFILGDGTNANYELIYSFAHQYVWGSVFLIYGSVKMLSLLKFVDYRIKILNGCVGLWAWNYIFLSFAIFDTTAMAPIEVLLLVPVIAEVWILISVVKKKVI